MSFYSQMLPSYTVGDDAYKNVPAICEPYGTKAVVIGGKRAIEAAKDYLLAALTDSKIEIIDFIWYGGEASFENGDVLIANPKVQEADMVFAVGGGKAIDCCKYVTYVAKKPLFSFPTIAGTCAPVSSVAVIYYPTGVIRDTWQRADGMPPIHVFINTTVIAEAPEIYLWTGMADTMAKHFETTLASRGKALTHGDAFGVAMGVQCYKPLVQYGAKALADCRNNTPSFEVEQICLCILVTTGMVSNFIDFSINSSIAHSLFYGMTVLPQIEEKHLHGEVVSYGVLVLLMYDGQMDKLEELYDFYKTVKLPTKLADIEVTYDELGPAIETTLTVRDIKNAPYEVTAEKLYQAITDLEEYNKKRG
ncbi:iron-containing alcohol dehydrogenase family protein [Sporomusa sp. KB1]|jgi:glycerol dehydrogenase|uniref:iron-containing alcohol dehydrogenase family protein n=1 Tax=Sporomusa sp. KB1 TaxID=943346 RepID=UPI00119DBE2B|nr:iron-containing alcohol dehydrogenase family protein [Sporomusa sp. KB1]TWH47323.1 glycerol dehydrogenase [Sporomusa sp. KB1]